MTLFNVENPLGRTPDDHNHILWITREEATRLRELLREQLQQEFPSGIQWGCAHKLKIQIVNEKEVNDETRGLDIPEAGGL
jgi:hypothetical protein